MEIFLLVVFIIMALYLVYQVLTVLIIKVPHIKTKQNRLDKVLANLEVNSDTNIYELGCGTAEFLFQIEKQGAKKLTGFELSPLVYLQARLKTILKKSQAQIKCQNFMQADLSQADIIYMFLVNSVVQQTWQKIKQEVKPGTIIVVLCDQIKGLKPYKVIELDNGQTKINFYRK